jgi:hypothetical protein
VFGQGSRGVSLRKPSPVRPSVLIRSKY